MVIRQGDIYWIDLGQPIGSEPGYVRPYVVIQNDVLNSSRIRTVIVCASLYFLQDLRNCHTRTPSLVHKNFPVPYFQNRHHARLPLAPAKLIAHNKQE